MKATKGTLNEIIDISRKLPERFDVSYQNCLISGRDIFLSGLEMNGIEPNEEEHLIKMPMYMLVNHKRRMIRAFNSNGLDGLKSYINKVVDLN